MGTSKSPVDVEFYLTLIEAMLEDLTAHYPSLSKTFKRDAATIRRRASLEGISFLTVLLPRFGKAVEKAFATASLAETPGLSKVRGSRVIPRLFSGLTLQLFDLGGRLRSDAPAHAVRHLRQITQMFYKLELPYSREKETRVIESFIANDEQVKQDGFDEEVIAYANRIAASVLAEFDWRDVKPKHGPGAVATGEKGDQKWKFSRLYNSIHQVYPYYDYFMVSGRRQLEDTKDDYFRMTRLETGTAKVVLVPKDSRGPRLISCEPLEFQWIQQGIARKLMSLFESHRLTKGHVNFTYQTINQQLALKASAGGEFATLDLKDASDMVSLELVRRIMPERAHRYLEGTRSTATILPDGRCIALRKFAPMGSALCFPVESFVFWCLSVASIVVRQGWTLNAACAAVYVYGDDIIVYTPCAYSVMSGLEDAGLIVNRAKSFVSGPFRESCGMDAFKGADVTIARVKCPWSSTSWSGEMIASWVALANLLYEKGYTNAAFRCCSAIRERIPIPRTPMGSEGVGFAFDSSGCPVDDCEASIGESRKEGLKVGWDSERQSRYVMGYVLVTKKQPTRAHDWSRLLRDLTLGTVFTPDHETVRRAVTLKRKRIYPRPSVSQPKWVKDLLDELAH